jgi:hypothetical protein
MRSNQLRFKKSVDVWVNRNIESLRSEYRSYGVAHDYDPDGVMSFASFCERQFRFEHCSTCLGYHGFNCDQRGECSNCSEAA